MRIHQLTVGLLSTNCYLAEDEETKETVVIDPGDQAETIEAYIEEKGLRPVMVLLTHGHMDHLMAAAPLRSAYNCPIRFHEEEVSYMRSEAVKRSLYHRELFETVIKEALKGPLLHDMEEIRFGRTLLRTIEVPGHTAHSLCYYAEEDGILFAGDTLFCRSLGRTDFYEGEPWDLAEAVEKRILSLPDGVRVLPGHGPATTVGEERLCNPYLGGSREV